jgi:drug/metabolite transporter (DMT)-like permease
MSPYDFDTGIPFFQAGELYALSCALLWAVAVILFRKTGETIEPVALNLFKGVVGLALFLVTMPIFGVPWFPQGVSLADWLVLMGSGALGIAIADSVFFASLNRLGAGRSAIVDCLYSPFVVLCSALYLGEPRGPWLLPAMALMVVAILVGTWSPEERTVDSAARKLLREGVALGILAMLTMAVGIVLAKPVLDRSQPMWATSVRLLGGVIFLAIQGSLPRWRRGVAKAFRPGPHWKVAVPAALIGTYFALFLWILGMTYTQTNTASVLNQSSTVFVLILATIFLREPLTWRRGVAIIIGMAAAVLVAL